jgi:biotin carboxyl carrier protein
VSFHGVFREGGRERVVSAALKDGVLRGSVDGKPLPDTCVRRDGAVYVLARGAEVDRAVVAREGGRVLVHFRGRVHELELAGAGGAARERGARHAHGADEDFAASPMTGIVASVAVKPGDAVPKGGTLAVVEAMKMQFTVRAPRDVVVKAVRAEAGKPVDIGAVLVEFAPAIATA